MEQRTRQARIMTPSGMYETDLADYFVLTDSNDDMFFPVIIPTDMGDVIKSATMGMELNLENFGIFFSLVGAMKTCDMSPTKIIIEASREDSPQCGDIVAVIESVNTNRLGVSVSHVPAFLPDAVLMGILMDIPFAVFNDESDPILVPIDKTVGSLPGAIYKYILEYERNHRDSIMAETGMPADDAPAE